MVLLLSHLEIKNRLGLDLFRPCFRILFELLTLGFFSVTTDLVFISLFIILPMLLYGCEARHWTFLGEAKIRGLSSLCEFGIDDD